MYAVMRATEQFRLFLLGREFLLRTDHAALAKLLRRDLPPTTRVERWILRLSEYTIRIKHQRGIDVMADVLSRLPFMRGVKAERPASEKSAGGSNGGVAVVLHRIQACAASQIPTGGTQILQSESGRGVQ